MQLRKFAYFLPQFYPTPENDKYWGEGFTEWTNVRKAQKFFSKHSQPIKPEKFGYYNLLEKKSLFELSEYSKEKGLDGFGYWHYWFGNGYQTLEKVPEKHLKDEKIKQNFFFSWANLNWTKSWVGNDTIIFKQEYSELDAIKHFEYLHQFFLDKRYIKIDGKPLLQVLKPNDPGCKQHIRILNDLAKKTFGVGIYWMFPSNDFLIDEDLDILISGYPPGEVLKRDRIYKLKKRLINNFIGKPTIVSSSQYLKYFKIDLEISIKKFNKRYIPSVLSGWDNTPRYGKSGFIVSCEIENILNDQIKTVVNVIDSLDSYNPNFILIKSFNEWCEGNILEPHYADDTLKQPLKTDLNDYFKE